MRKKLILILISLVVILLFSRNQIFASSIDIESSLATKISDTNVFTNLNYDYVINDYDIDINVTEDNIFEITEVISVTFNKQKHGIIRKIPLKNTVKRADETMSINKAQVTKVNVDTIFSTSNDGSYYSIKIGSKYENENSTKTYTIKYTYNIGNDPSKDYDELYYNLIGTEWDAPIEKVSFRITMPKRFDSSKLGFSIGEEGYSGYNSKNLRGNIIENVITGTYTKGLSPKQGITVRLELPEGYFKKQGFKMDFIDVLGFVLPIVFVIIAAYLWNKYGKDDQIVDAIEFYPPEGLNSLEVGRIYKGKAEQKHVISLLFYLADKGYLKIVEKDKKQVDIKSDFDENDSDAKKEFLLDMYAQKFNESNFQIVKLKDYDGDNEEEKIFMNGLFENRKQIIVDESDLKNSFYKTINRILKKANSTENRDKIFTKESTSKMIYFAIMIIITIILVIAKPLMESNVNINTNNTNEIINNIINAIINYGPELIYGALLVLAVFTSKKMFLKVLLTVVGLGAGIVLLYMNIGEVVLANSTYLAQNILGIICLITIFIFLILMKNRTPYGTEMLGKIKGFRTFLETAEKDKLEEMVKENPTYFYDILPYTYALDVSEIWINKFEIIAIEPPKWYESYEIYEIMDSLRSSAAIIMQLDETFKEINIAMTSIPKMYSGETFLNNDSSNNNSSDNNFFGGSGFSGGGFSGGGSGGGGGSSW